MILRRSLIGALAGVAFAISGFGYAGADTFNLVTGDDYAPFTGQTLPKNGLATEIVQTAFREMGMETDVTFRPWKRGYAETLSGKYLGTFPYGHNAKREEDFHYSEPLYIFGLYFFARSESDVTFTKDEDLQGQRVCMPIGWNPVRVQKMVDAGIVTMVRPPDLESCFQMLKRKRADLVRVNDISGWRMIERVFGTRDGFRQLPTPVRQNIEHLIIPRSNPDGAALINRFNAALEKLQKQGRIHKIIERHLD